MAARINAASSAEPNMSVWADPPIVSAEVQRRLLSSGGGWSSTRSIHWSIT